MLGYSSVHSSVPKIMPMDVNPYRSPTTSGGERSTLGIALLRVLAVACWVAALLPILGFLSVINRPEIAEKSEQHFPLFVGLNVIMFALPALGFALLGVASWRRSQSFLIAGIVAFLPIALATLAAALLHSRWEV